MDLRTELTRIKAIVKSGPKKIQKLAKDATYAAVEAAMEATPPVEDDLAGVKTRKGMLKSHWAQDSETKAVYAHGGWETRLKNNQPYASYVNDGHRMDKHFVPGLYVNPNSGKLEYDAAKKGKTGIVVGTKTQYVPGLFMAEKGEEAYGKAVDDGLRILAEEITGE